MAQTTMAPRPRVLYVDDDERALELLRAQAARQFDVVTATNGAAALQLLEEEGPFEIVVSDYQMIGMSGLFFLSKARDTAPDATRLLLTGHPNLTAAMGAVNDGQCFRFLTKPCSQEVMLRALQAAADQHRLVTSRRGLLEQTLRASVRALTDVLALASPAASGRANRARAHVSALLDHFNLPDRWEAEVAAMLSQIGCVSLPPETALKVYEGARLSPEEQAMVDRLPALAEQLVADIPQMEGVRAILRYQDKHFDGIGTPPGPERGEQIPWGARALKIALDYDVLEAQGAATHAALDTMQGRSGLWYDPALLEAFVEIRTQQVEVTQDLTLGQLASGMVFADDVRTRSGVIVIARGTKVTSSLSERLRNSPAGYFQEPVKVVALRTAEGNDL